MVYHTAGYHNVDPAVFLDMTLAEMGIYIEGVGDDKYDAYKLELITADKLNHMLGGYIAIATNEPQKYPKEAFLNNYEEEQQEPKEMTPEQIKLSLMAWMGVLGGEEEKDGE